MNNLEFDCRVRHPGGFFLNLAFAAPQRVTALFGPSGSGKTTALAAIAGLLRPEAGRICVGNPPQVVFDAAQHIWWPPERRGIGYVFQEHRLFPHLTVARNLRFGESRNPNANRDFDRVVSVLELEPLLTRYPRQLSGGESQRVALGRALLSAPRLLLLDEPLSAIDASLKQRILFYLDRILSEYQIPVLLVSHSQAEVRRLAEWVVVLQGGERIAAGTPDEVFGQPLLLSMPAEAGPVNLLKLDTAPPASAEPSTASIGYLHGQPLNLPPEAERSARARYLQCSPRDVVISLREVTGVSARNHLRGIVRQLTLTAEGVFVAVDVGQIIWAELTPAAVQELQLRPELPVLCLIKTHSLKIVD